MTSKTYLACFPIIFSSAKRGEFMAFRLGLTGGIACGKSTASKAFLALGIPVVDCDVISRELTSIGSTILEQIVCHFGEQILLEDGTLNRSLLRQIVFDDEKELAYLNTLLQGAIRQELISKTQEYLEKAPYVVLAIPLLFERKLENLTDRILVLDANEEVQLQRIIKRDACSKETALSIMKNQVDRSYRQSHGDDIIDTSSLSDKELSFEIEKLHQRYLALAKNEGKH